MGVDIGHFENHCSKCILAHIYGYTNKQKKTMSVSFSYVPPSVYILGFKLTVRLNLQFFLFPFERPLRRVLLHCTCHLCLHC